MNMPSFPTTVDFAITGKCNLRCKHCNTSSTWDLSNELSFDEICDVLDQLKDEKVFYINLFGGEPFCHPRIFEIFEKLNACPMRVDILTNGTLIDEKAIKEIKKLKYLGNVQISIDGSTSQIHDWQRGEGSFEKSMKAVRLLIKGNLPVSLKAIINSRNYTDLDNMMALVKDLKLSSMSFGDAVECGRAALYASDMRFEGEMQKYIMNEMLRIEKSYPDIAISGTLAQKIEMLRDFFSEGIGNGTRGTFSSCPAGNTMLSIRSDGKIVPCSAFWTLVCGDIRKQSFGEIWENSSVLNEIRALEEEPLVKYDKECKDCDYLSYCNGGCRAAAYYASGNDLKGFNKTECLVFSNLHGFRIDKETVMNREKDN